MKLSRAVNGGQKSTWRSNRRKIMLIPLDRETPQSAQTLW